MTQQPGVSGYVSQIRRLEEPKEARHRRAREVAERCFALPDDALPPLPYVNIIGSDTYAHFRGMMADKFVEFVDRFQLSGDSRILDIGCGCGRLALPFSLFVEGGCYVGIDVWQDGIDWCRSNISGAGRPVEFHCLAAENNYYFEAFRSEVANSYALPFLGNESIDLALAVSVFTHLTEADCRAYFRELRRVLAHEGAAYLTCFIIDDFFFRHVARTGFHQAVREIAPGCYNAYEGQDFFAGYTMAKWRSMLDEANLRIVSHEVGSWAEKPGAKEYQDTFVVIPA